MLAVFVILIFSLSFGVLIVGTNTARSIKSANKQNELDIKKANEWNPHLEIPGWKWYDDLRQRLDQITTEVELNHFDTSAFGQRKKTMVEYRTHRDHATPVRTLNEQREINSRYSEKDRENRRHPWNLMSTEFKKYRAMGREVNHASKYDYMTGSYSHYFSVETPSGERKGYMVRSLKP